MLSYDGFDIRCASFVTRLWRMQRSLSQPLKAMRRVATVPADVNAKQPRRTAITAANLEPNGVGPHPVVAASNQITSTTPSASKSQLHLRFQFGSQVPWNLLCYAGW